jgi:hypothetical protein
VRFETARRRGDVENLTGLAGKAVQQLRQHGPLTDLRQLDRIALDAEPHVVTEPSRPGGALATQGEWETPGRHPVDVVTSRRQRSRDRGNCLGRILQERLEQILSHPGDLPLGQRKDRQHVQPARQRLRGARNRVVTGRPGQHRRARNAALPVQSRLERVEQIDRPLVLVDAHRRRARHRQRRVPHHRIQHRRVIEIDHLDTTLGREAPQQGRLPHRARTMQRDHWLVSEQRREHLLDPAGNDPLRQPGHAPTLPADRNLRVLLLG